MKKVIRASVRLDTGLRYSGLDANTDLSLRVLTPKNRPTIFTFAVQDEFIDMSTAEITRLRDDLNQILRHEKLHADFAAAVQAQEGKNNG